MVLTVIFVYTVYDSLAMPDVDTRRLARMGLSSGMSLGCKFPDGDA